MQPHTFGPVQHTKEYEDHPYRQCQKCGRVKFEGGDDYFNMSCSVASKKIEDLRSKLENKS